MNRIDRLFQEKSKEVLSIYMTAGYPALEDTLDVIVALEKAGADMIEIGIPFSDPLADGPVIQESSQLALENGISLKKIFEQIKDVRQEVKIPLVLMGYLNPILQYGMEAFVRDAVSAGIDGVILPDLPMDLYKRDFQGLFEGAGLHKIMLITPQTSEERIEEIAKTSKGFLYMVSDSSTTGAKKAIKSSQISYFERISKMELALPRLIGFGISNSDTFYEASAYANGAIIGSAFVKALQDDKQTLEARIDCFVKSIIQK